MFKVTCNFDEKSEAQLFVSSIGEQWDETIYGCYTSQDLNKWNYDKWQQVASQLIDQVSYLADVHILDLLTIQEVRDVVDPKLPDIKRFSSSLLKEYVENTLKDFCLDRFSNKCVAWLSNSGSGKLITLSFHSRCTEDAQQQIFAALQTAGLSYHKYLDDKTYHVGHESNIKYHNEMLKAQAKERPWYPVDRNSRDSF